MDTAAFFAAIREGDLIRAEALLLAEPLLAVARDESGLSALMVSLYYRQSLLTPLLLDQGIVLDLFESAALGDTGRLRQLIDQDPAGVYAFAPDGFTALHFAAYFGRPEAVRLLLERGARIAVEADNDLRVQPLHSAVAGKNLEAVRLLLAAGADPNAQQAGGYTPLDGAVQTGDAALIALLREHGARPGAGQQGLVRGDR